MQFRDLAIGQRFDFIGPVRSFNSFTERCRKISARKYESLRTGAQYQVGTVNVMVYHIGGTDKESDNG